jgi:hypothetical protein
VVVPTCTEHPDSQKTIITFRMTKARPFLLLVSRVFLERHMEGGKKIKIKLYFPTFQKCLHQIFRAEDEKKIKNLF